MKVTRQILLLLFSFLASEVYAGLLKGLDIAADGDAALGLDALIVVLLSFGFALLAIGWMMRWLARADFRIFVWYRMVLGGALLLAIASGAV